MRLRTLVVDDEPIARRLLCSFVRSVEWMHLIGDADRGTAAMSAIGAHEPDLVFLDIKLPDTSGIEIVERAVRRPHVVFTTAYDEFAIRALQLGAVDYIVKPFGRRRFLEAADRVRARVSATVPLTPSNPGTHQTQSAKRIYVKDRGVVVPVSLDAIDRIEAHGDYSTLYAGARTLLIDQPLGRVEKSLDSQRFVRVHRSHIVNLDHVTAFREFDARRYVVVMRSGFEVMASEAGTRLLRALVI